MTGLETILIGLAIGAAVSTATMIPQAIISSNQAQAMANYQAAVALAQADYKNEVAELEADELARKAKFTFGSQRATAAAMGLGMTGTSAEDIQQMDVGLATLDVQKKLYEGEVALWEGQVTAQLAQYEADVAKHKAWTSTAWGIGIGAVAGAIGGVGGAAANTTISGSGISLGAKITSGITAQGWGPVYSGALQGALGTMGASRSMLGSY